MVTDAPKEIEGGYFCIMFDVMFRKREVTNAVSTVLVTIAYELFAIQIQAILLICQK